MIIVLRVICKDKNRRISKRKVKERNDLMKIQVMIPYEFLLI
jgi:hypothetical protein